MRTLTAAALFALALNAAAQSAPRPIPPGSVPIDDPGPPPPMTEQDKNDPRDKLETQVTKRTEGDNEIEEYRVNGKLYMQRVTPKGGVPYVLLDSVGDGTFTRLDNTLAPNVRVPQWVLHRF
jgi:hypothetical protein